MILFKIMFGNALHSTVLNPFNATGFILYPLKTSENQRSFDAFRGGVER